MSHRARSNSFTIRSRRLLAHILGITMIVSVVGVASVGAQSAEDDPAQVEAGMAVFETSCAGCHGAGGEGSNLGRPLTDVATQQPDRSVHVASVTNGKGNMPAFGTSLEAEEIDAAVSYVRLTFVSAQDEDAELAVTGQMTSTMILLAMVAMVSGIGMAVLGRRTAAEG